MSGEPEKSWQLLLWKTLPLRFLSYVWGSVHRTDLPSFLRAPLYRAWTRAFDVQLHEIEGFDPAWIDDDKKVDEFLQQFPNLNAFFIRRIDLDKWRPMSADVMVSPVDGRVNIFGEVDSQGLVQQIKGMNYRLDDLLGYQAKKLNEPSRLYYYVLYLAPGDYHRMHCPADDVVVKERLHFPGALYPVAPKIAQYIPALFVRNERVVLKAEWTHGSFALVPVGAYNVGSMKLTFDEGLDTNLREHTVIHYKPSMEDGLVDGHIPTTPYIKTFTSDETSKELQVKAGEVAKAAEQFALSEAQAMTEPEDRDKVRVPSARTASHLPTTHPPPKHDLRADGLHLRKGEEFSRFELGSTIVVLFELPTTHTFNWNIEPEQKVQVGQRMGVIVQNKEWKQTQKEKQQAQGGGSSWWSFAFGSSTSQDGRAHPQGSLTPNGNVEEDLQEPPTTIG